MPKRTSVAWRTGVPLAGLTTLGVGGPARSLLDTTSTEQLIAAVAELDAAGQPLLLVGGGSNLLVADDGFDGAVLLIRTRGVSVARHDGRVRLRVAAGEPWDDLVARAVAEGWSGIECLSGIPGLAGATPVQNVGAYGQQIADTLVGLEAYDRHVGEVVQLSSADCKFSYRNSIFKHTDRYVVLAVTLELSESPRARPVGYAGLTERVGTSPTNSEVRTAVLELRRSKGMVLDPADPDSHSAGSFFTNPIVDADALRIVESRLKPGQPYPHWPDAGGTKLSAAWLIEHAGFLRGFGAGAAKVSSKHTLALTNTGGAAASDIVDLAATIVAGVESEFGVRLRPEPRLVGLTL